MRKIGKSYIPKEFNSPELKYKSSFEKVSIMSNESSSELVVKSAPHIWGPMSKSRMMQLTFVALLIITAVSAALWSQVTVSNYISGVSGWNLGLTVVICALIAVGVAVGTDFLLHKLVSDSELNIWSAAVFGLIVTDSYTLGLPTMNMSMGPPVEAPAAFIFVALISLVGLVVFKKLQGLAGRKFVNPAAAAKFLVLLPILGGSFLAAEHLPTSILGVPSLAGPLGAGLTPVGTNGLASFATYMTGCFANPLVVPPDPTIQNIFSMMLLDKYHGWIGGASSLAVIVVGIALFAIARKYFKWRITASYFIGAAVMSIIMSSVYGDADLLVRLMFTIFIGSSIFLGFFMATDPATTPYTGTGQIIFGVGLAVLTVLIQTYMNFFGGSLLALLIMNLTVPLLDRVGIHKSFGR
jgi:Na+-translocating ferredoxin:NAD+ oxidoreductase subunit D